MLLNLEEDNYKDRQLGEHLEAANTWDQGIGLKDRGVFGKGLFNDLRNVEEECEHYGEDLSDNLLVERLEVASNVQGGLAARDGVFLVVCAGSMGRASAKRGGVGADSIRGRDTV